MSNMCSIYVNVSVYRYTVMRALSVISCKLGVVIVTAIAIAIVIVFRG